MPVITKLQRYKDERGNRIVYDGDADLKVTIEIAGSNNRVVIASDARFGRLGIMFKGDNGFVKIGSSSPAVPTPMRFWIRVGHQSRVTVGDNVSCAGSVFVSAVEGARVSIGDDVMFASGVEVRCDDVHPIFDVTTGTRSNTSESIRIRSHVWIAGDVTVLGGATVGQGSVIGLRSVVTKSIPNNCVAVGVPAKVIRRNVAWSRPTVFAQLPGQTQPREGEKERIAAYWNLTRDVAPPANLSLPRRLRRRLGRVRRGVLHAGRRLRAR